MGNVVIETTGADDGAARYHRVRPVVRYGAIHTIVTQCWLWLVKGLLLRHLLCIISCLE